MIEHMVKGCVLPRQDLPQADCLHLCSFMWPEGWTQSGATLGSFKNQPLLEEINLWDLGCFLRNAAGWESFYQLSEFSSSFCVWLLAYLQILCLVSLRISLKKFCFFVSRTAVKVNSVASAPSNTFCLKNRTLRGLQNYFIFYYTR